MAGREKKDRLGRKGSVDDKQGKLAWERDKIVKKVVFKDEGDNDWRAVKDMMCEMKEELSGEIEKLKKEWKEWADVMEERFAGIEKDISDIKEFLGDKAGMEEENAGSGYASDRSVGGYSRATSRGSRFGGIGSKEGSMWSISRGSEGFNDRERDRLRKMMREKEKEERRNNIVLKGVSMEGMVTKEWLEGFIKEKLDVNIKVVSCRKSGKVIIATLEGEGMKREVMTCKSKLKGGKIFIENDLTWEERKTQERIYRWVKEEREKGKDVKVGFARVKIEGIWRKWEEIEKDLGREERGRETVRGRKDEDKGEEQVRRQDLQ